MVLHTPGVGRAAAHVAAGARERRQGHIEVDKAGAAGALKAVLRTAQRWILTTSREVAATFVTILLRLVDSTSDLEHGVVVVSSEDEI